MAEWIVNCSNFCLFSTGYSCSAGLLLNVIVVKFLSEDFSKFEISSLVLTALGSLFLIIIIYLDNANC